MALPEILDGASGFIVGSGATLVLSAFYQGIKKGTADRKQEELGNQIVSAVKKVEEAADSNRLVSQRFDEVEREWKRTAAKTERHLSGHARLLGHIIQLLEDWEPRLSSSTTATGAVKNILGMFKEIDDERS